MAERDLNRVALERGVIAITTNRAPDTHRIIALVEYDSGRRTVQTIDGHPDAPVVADVGGHDVKNIVVKALGDAPRVIFQGAKTK